MPLFVDFLLLPSVKDLWCTSGTITDQRWQNSLEAIREELDEYRVDLCLRARNAILDATTDRGSRGGADDDSDTEKFDDAFFQRATSFVCCAFPGCPRKQDPPSYRWDWLKRRHVVDNEEQRAAKDTRIDWIGPLAEVLRHQHKHHNHKQALTAQQEKVPETPERICLPLEVACGMISILELHDLDETRAEKKHLMRANESTSGYKWVNSKQTRYRFQSRPRYYHSQSAWSTLIHCSFRIDALVC